MVSAGEGSPTRSLILAVSWRRSPSGQAGYRPRAAPNQRARLGRCSGTGCFSTDTAGTGSQGRHRTRHRISLPVRPRLSPPGPPPRSAPNAMRFGRGLSPRCGPIRAQFGPFGKRDQPACESAIFLKSLSSVARYQPWAGTAGFEAAWTPPCDWHACRRAPLRDDGRLTRANPSSKAFSALISGRHAYSV